MRRARAFARFWYDFVIGEDWTVAAAVVAGLAVTAAIAHHHMTSWIILPAVATAVLGASVWRATRS